MARKIIPFGWMPGHWGLAGKTRDVAKAEYELEGLELDNTVARITIEDELELERKLLANSLKYGLITLLQYERDLLAFSNLTDEDKKKQNLEIDLKHGIINQYDYEIAMNAFVEDETNRKLLKLGIDLAHDKITQKKFDKETATIKGERWVDVVSLTTQEGNPEYGDFELDWNDIFIQHLEDNGFIAPTPDAMVDMWFNSVCKNVALTSALSEEEIEQLTANANKVTKIKKGRK